MRDVAHRAGVSIATVSRVFNGSPRVRDDTARRVWTAATDLDYWPHSGARSLTTSRSEVIGVLLPEIFGEFYSEVIRGIDDAARRSRCQVLISSSHADSNEMIAAARAMLGRIDGLIMMVSDEASIEAVYSIRQRFPLILLNPCRSVAGCSSVSIANFDGARRAVSHLIGLGHRDIAMLKGPEGNVDSSERVEGYRRALWDAGIEARPSLEIRGDFKEMAGYRAAGEILVSEPRPSAVFAANDSMAVGLLSGLRNMGIAIPAEMAVVGFDDIAIAQYLSPALTTVSVDAHRLGRWAVELLIPDEGGDESPGGERHILATELVVRESCGSPSGSKVPDPAQMETGKDGREPKVLPTQLLVRRS